MPTPLDLFDHSLLLDMIILGTHQLCGGVNILFFFKVSFEKHPSAHGMVHMENRAHMIHDTVVISIVLECQAFQLICPL